MLQAVATRLTMTARVPCWSIQCSVSDGRMRNGRWQRLDGPRAESAGSAAIVGTPRTPRASKRHPGCVCGSLVGRRVGGSVRMSWHLPMEIV